MNKNTIAAISTPIGTGGIGIIKISGPQSYEIVEKLVKSSLSLEPRKMELKTIKTKDFEDKALVVYFKSPNSYTGEDIIEIHSHGGMVIQKGILNEVLDKGAQIATPGEFTKRAYLNNKISLDSAEGVIDMINAESEAEIRAGYSLLKGNLNKKVKTHQKTITDILARIEALLDYPEDDIEEKDLNYFMSSLNEAKKEISQILNSAKVGRLIKGGVNVSIIGSPNVGKSSLMNALLDYDRSIVTEIEGTTRDTIEDSYTYKGIKINIIDTAGIRESEDQVEKIGVERSKESIRNSDFVLFVLDQSKNIEKEELSILEYLQNKNKKKLIVLNKDDLSKDLEIRKKLEKRVGKENITSISALNLTGIEMLKEKIYDKVIDSKIISGNILLTNERHINALEKSKEHISEAIDSIKNNLTLDLTVIDIKKAWDCLGEITGESSSEKIVDRIFEKFCLGK